jgi:hypothetical protein
MNSQRLNQTLSGGASGSVALTAGSEDRGFGDLVLVLLGLFLSTKNGAVNVIFSNLSRIGTGQYH